jgi:hypothetical protein
MPQGFCWLLKSEINQLEFTSGPAGIDEPRDSHILYMVNKAGFKFGMSIAADRFFHDEHFHCVWNILNFHRGKR